MCTPALTGVPASPAVTAIGNEGNDEDEGNGTTAAASTADGTIPRMDRSNDDTSGTDMHRSGNGIVP